jgi:hypothetical protein
MGFWRDFWRVIRDPSQNEPATDPAQWRDAIDPNWRERDRLKRENADLKRRRDLLKLEEENIVLAEEIGKLQKRKDERDRRERQS